jgi:hypothetical protein
MRRRKKMCLNRNEFRVRNEHLQLIIFFFLLHLTQVFVVNLKICILIEDDMSHPLIFLINFL